MGVSDEEKYHDRLADENDAMELVNATTNMLGFPHHEGNSSQHPRTGTSHALTHMHTHSHTHTHTFYTLTNSVSHGGCVGRGEVP